jgi:hypothetical protein
VQVPVPAEEPVTVMLPLVPEPLPEALPLQDTDADDALRVFQLN